jgi:glycerol kinase
MDCSLIQAMGLFDFRAGNYWSEWLELLGIPRQALPSPTATLADFGYLTLADKHGMTASAPVLAMLGDQQAALFGQGCRTPGAAEATQGTASFVKVFTGAAALEPESINVYYAWDLGAGQTYCLEAPTMASGAAIRWMRDAAGFIKSYDEVQELATGVPDSGGVTFVPAFTGLDVPYNDPDSRASLLGLTLGTHRGHVVRAFLESLGFQLRAILDTIAAETGLHVETLRVGGGVTASDEACQIEADLTGLPVVRGSFTEHTAWAAAVLAGLGAGCWSLDAGLPRTPGESRTFIPRLDAAARDERYAGWQKAITLVQAYANPLTRPFSSRGT